MWAVLSFDSVTPPHCYERPTDKQNRVTADICEVCTLIVKNLYAWYLSSLRSPPLWFSASQNQTGWQRHVSLDQCIGRLLKSQGLTYARYALDSLLRCCCICRCRSRILYTGFCLSHFATRSWIRGSFGDRACSKNWRMVCISHGIITASLFASYIWVDVVIIS